MTQSSVTVGEVLGELIRHPIKMLVRRWNWKSAVMSALVRGSLFFATNIGAGLSAALGAMSIESAFYFTIAGFYGAMIQSFRRARPVWAATLTVMVLMPIVNHSLELTFHWIGGTERLSASIMASVGLSICSAVFNLFAMRRGILIVGEGRQSLIADLRSLPLIIIEFLTVPPRSLLRSLFAPDRCRSGRRGESANQSGD
jgi:hypothetical protein